MNEEKQNKAPKEETQENQFLESKNSQNNLYNGNDGNGDSGSAEDDSHFKQNPYLPTGLQRKAEELLREDFSNVNVYKDSSDATGFGARAYTQGNSIYFAPGKFDPYSQEGKRLISHELVHIAQQRKGLASGLTGTGKIDRAESQADAIANSLMEGNNTSFDLEPIAFNTLQLKPDYTYPAEWEELFLFYYVYVPNNTNKNGFENLIAEQVYRNPGFEVYITSDKDFYKGGKATSVKVDLKRFIENLLHKELSENKELFEQRRYMIYQFFYREWLKENENGALILKYLDDNPNQEGIIAEQDELIKQLRNIYNNGQIIRKEEIYIPSYNRSTYESGVYKDSDEKVLDTYTSKEEALFISDDILQHQPIANSKDYIELRLQRIPKSKQVARITLQYFYYHEATGSFWPSEDYEVTEFHPYKNYTSEEIFNASGNEININYQSTTIGLERTPVPTNISIKLHRSGNRITIDQGFDTLNAYWQIGKGQLELVESNNFHKQKYRKGQEIGHKFDGRTLIERKFREKQLYANKRDHNAIKRLDQLRDYYGEDNSYAKVQGDFNRFFVNTNLSAIKLLDPADQFTFMYLLQSLESDKELTFEAARNILLALLDVYGFELEELKDVSDMETFKLVLLTKKMELEETRTQYEKYQAENFTTTDIGDWLPEKVQHIEENKPFEVKNLEKLLSFFLAYLYDPKKGANNLTSALNDHFANRLLTKSRNLSEQQNKLNTIQKAIEEKDEAKKLKIVQEILDQQTKFVLDDPWINQLRKAKSIEAFKAILQEKPESQVTTFFSGLLDGSLLKDVIEAEEKTNELLKAVGDNRSIKAPLERLNNKVGHFLQENDLQASQLIRINAVFYPGEEAIRKEAKVTEAIPINLYTYTKDEKRFVVLFIDNGKEVRDEVFEVPGKTKEILTADLLGYIDEQKVLGQGILYYDDYKKFDGESGYTKTVSSYEFVTPISNWEYAANITSGVVFVASLFAGPAGWARNGAFLMTMFGLSATSAVAVSVNKYRKSVYRDLDAKDWADLIFTWGGLGFDAVKGANLMRMLRKMNANNPQKVQQILKLNEQIEGVQLYWTIGDITYNMVDLYLAFSKHKLGFWDGAYSLAQLAFTVKGVSSQLKQPKILNKAISSDFAMDKSLEYSRYLNDNGDIAMSASKEFQIALSYFPHERIEILQHNLKALKAESPEVHQTFLSNFGKGKLALEDYALLVKMTTTKTKGSFKAEIETHLNEKGVAIENQKSDPIGSPEPVVKTNEKIEGTKTKIKENKTEQERVNEELFDEMRNIQYQGSSIEQMKSQLTKTGEFLTTKNKELIQQKARVKTSTGLLNETGQLIGTKEKIAGRKAGEIELADKQLDRFNATLSAQEKTIQGIKKDINEKKRTVEKNTESIDAFEGKKGAIEDQVNTLDKKIRTLNEEVIPGYNAEIGRKEAQLKEIDGTIKTKKDELETFQAQMGEKEQKLKDLNNYSVEQEIKDIDVEIAALDRKHRHKPLSPFDAQYKAQLVKRQNELKRRPGKQKRKIRKEKKAVERELEKMKEQEKMMQEEIKGINGERFVIEHRLNQTVEKKGKAVERVNKHTETKGNLESEMVEVKTKLKELEDEIGELNKQLIDDGKLQSEKQQEYNELKGKIEEAENSIKAMEAELAKTTEEIETLRDKEEGLREELSTAISEKNKTETEIAAKIQEGKKTQLELNEAEIQYSATSKKWDELMAEEKALIESMGDLKGELKKAELDKLKQLKTYEKSFHLDLLRPESGNNSSKGFLLQVIHPWNFVNAFFKLKRHQVKRMIRMKFEDENTLTHDEDYVNAVDEMKTEIYQTLIDLSEAKANLLNNVKEDLKEVLNDGLITEKQNLLENELAQESTTLAIEQLKFKIMMLPKDTSPESLENDITKKQAELAELKAKEKEIGAGIEAINQAMDEMDKMNKNELNDWFSNGDTTLPMDLWETLKKRYNAKVDEVSWQLEIINVYLKDVRSLSKFIEANYTQGVQKTK